MAGVVAGVALVVHAGVGMFVVSWHVEGGVTWADGVLLALYGAGMLGLLTGLLLPRAGGIMTLVAVALHALGMMLLYSARFDTAIYSWFLVPSVLNLIAGRRPGSGPPSRGVAALVSGAALVVILQDVFFGSVPFHPLPTPSRVALMMLYGTAVVGLVIGFWRPRIGGVVALVAYLSYEAGLRLGGLTGYTWTLLYLFTVPAALNLLVRRPIIERGEV